MAQSVKKAKVTNYLVVAIDAELRDYLVENQFNVYYRDTTVSVLQANLLLVLPVAHCFHPRCKDKSTRAVQLRWLHSQSGPEMCP